MNRKLRVDGIDDEITTEDLREAFEPFGTLDDVKVVDDRETGRSMGYGFVTFHAAEDAVAARQQLDNSRLNHVTIRVAPA